MYFSWALNKKAGVETVSVKDTPKSSSSSIAKTAWKFHITTVGAPSPAKQRSMSASSSPKTARRTNSPSSPSKPLSPIAKNRRKSAASAPTSTCSTPGPRRTIRRRTDPDLDGLCHGEQVEYFAPVDQQPTGTTTTTTTTVTAPPAEPTYSVLTFEPRAQTRPVPPVRHVQQQMVPAAASSSSSSSSSSVTPSPAPAVPVHFVPVASTPSPSDYAATAALSYTPVMVPQPPPQQGVFYDPMYNPAAAAIGAPLLLHHTGAASFAAPHTMAPQPTVSYAQPPPYYHHHHPAQPTMASYELASPAVATYATQQPAQQHVMAQQQQQQLQQQLQQQQLQQQLQQQVATPPTPITKLSFSEVLDFASVDQGSSFSCFTEPLDMYLTGLDADYFLNGAQLS